MSGTKRSFKRPFQPSISSRFGHSARDGGTPCGAPKIPTPVSALPTTIQSSLINVGMRVRKSVSEGYQTQRKLTCGVPNAYNNFAWEHNSVTPSRDLSGPIPYGIRTSRSHRHPSPSEEDLPPLQFDSDHWGSPSSQESKASSDSTPPLVNVPVASSRKRCCEYEDDDLDVESEPGSPRSYPPFSHTRMPNLDHLRPIAMPKTRKKPVLESPDLIESEMIDVGDFGEAGFFRADEWGEDWGHGTRDERRSFESGCLGILREPE